MRPMVLFSVVVALAAALAPASVAPGQSLRDEGAFEYPDTEIAQHVRRFVEIFNARDEGAASAFSQEVMDAAFRAAVPTDQFTRIVWQLRDVWGEIAPQQVLTSSDNDLTILARAAEGEMWVNIVASTSATDEGRLSGLLMQQTEAPDIAAEGDPFSTGWDGLDDLVTKAHAMSGAPAMALAVYEGDELTGVAVVGERRSTSGIAVEDDDRFHLGSVTKSMTATMIGSLVADGALSWDTTLEEALPGVEMLEAYKPVTLAQLLRHRAGLPAHLLFAPDELARLNGLEGTPAEQRATYVAEVLMLEPAAQPGTTSTYSNAGYAVAAHIAERAAGRSWSDLVGERVFEAIGMGSAGFGWPDIGGDTDQPYGHINGVPITPEQYPLGAFLSPAGDTHCSVIDLARYGRAHLAALLGEDGPLDEAIVRELHRPAEPATPESPGFACGWMILPSPDRATAHWHNGSVGTFYALLVLVPDEDRVIAIITNGAGPEVEGACWRAVAEWQGATGTSAE